MSVREDVNVTYSYEIIYQQLNIRCSGVLGNDNGTYADFMVRVCPLFFQMDMYI